MPKILIVDDHYIVRNGLKLIIKSFLPHYNIDEAHDGDSSFEKIKDNEYDLIIMDVNMPATDSFGLVNTILSFKPEIKILMFSMNDDEIYAKRYLKMGAMGYLRKDEAESEIKKAITNVLNNKRYISAGLSERLLLELSEGSPENPFNSLSPREFEIAQHLARGESSLEICGKLKLHPSTIATHKARIFEKLKCKNIVDLNTLARVYNITSLS